MDKDPDHAPGAVVVAIVAVVADVVAVVVAALVCVLDGSQSISMKHGDHTARFLRR